jgi:hypothetical protein
MSFTETRTVQTAPTQEDSMTVRSHAAAKKTGAITVKDEAGSSSDEEPAPKQRRKAPTECYNNQFAKSLTARQTSHSQDFAKLNVLNIQKKSEGRLPQPRIELPAGVDVFPYS